MISVQEKLNIYRQFLKRQTAEEREKLIGEAEQRASDEKAAAEVKLAEEKAAITDHLTRIENRDAVKILSEGKSTIKDTKLRLQKELTAQFEQAILDLVPSFRDKPIYKTYFENSIGALAEAHLVPQELFILIDPQDEALFTQVADQLLPGFTFRFEKPKQNIYGGFSATDGDERINYDFTVKSLVSSHKKLIGTELRKAMGGVF